MISVKVWIPYQFLFQKMIVPYYRKLTLYKINCEFPKFVLILVALIYVNVYFRTVNCQRAIRAKTLGWRGGSRIEPRKSWKKCNLMKCRFPWDQVVSCEPIKRQYQAHGLKLNNKQNFTHFPPSWLPVFIYLNFFVKPGHRSQETWALDIFY